MNQFLPFPGLIPLALLFVSCGSTSVGGPAVPAEDPTWAGEVSLIDEKTVFRPCGRETGFPLRGPALDSLLPLYHAQVMQPGQRMMAWLTGHLTANDSLPADSFFHAVELEHLDALRMCPLLPLPRLAARFSTTLDDILGDRNLTLDLYPDGFALQQTQLRGRSMPFEQEGQWGVDGSGMLGVDWGPSFPMGYFKIAGDSLVRSQAMADGSMSRFVLVRNGPPDPSAGLRGMVLQWLHAVAKVHCAPFDRPTAPNSTALTTLFSTPELLQALEDSAVTWLPLDTATLHVGDPGLTTLGDLTAHKRRALLLQP